MSEADLSRRDQEELAFKLYADPEAGLSLLEIAGRFGRSIGWILALKRRRKWPDRVKVMPGATIEVRAAAAAQRARPLDRTALDRKLHGDLADEVAFLRDRMGFSVGRFRGGYAVNNEVMSAAALRALAIEWRRRKGVSDNSAGGQPAASRE